MKQVLYAIKDYPRGFFRYVIHDRHFSDSPKYEAGVIILILVLVLAPIACLNYFGLTGFAIAIGVEIIFVIVWRIADNAHDWPDG